MKFKKISESFRWHIKYREKTSKEEANYIISVIKFFEKELKERYISILDVACGNGRLHPFLRNAGFEVFGIDISTELINEAKKKYPKFKDYYIISDMRSFKLGRKFDVVLCWFTSFGYFSDKENIKVLINIANHLRKNGIFLLEIPNKIVLLEKIKSHPFNIFVYKDIVEIDKYKIKKIKNQVFWILIKNFYFKKGRDLKFIKSYTSKVRLYSQSEIKELLKKANLRVIEIFKSMTMQKLDEKTDARMLIISKK